jgi:hypothetical protein
VRVYMIGVLTILACNMILLVPLVNRSAQGAILDTAARRLVAPLLTVKYAPCIIIIFFLKGESIQLFTLASGMSLCSLVGDYQHVCETRLHLETGCRLHFCIRS